MPIGPVSLDVRNGVVVAGIEGDIDISNTAVIAAAILAAVENEAVGVVVDLDRVRYIDSAGVRMLFDIARRLSTRRQRTGVALSEDSPMRKLLKITNIDEVVTVCATVHACVEAVREAG